MNIKRIIILALLVLLIPTSQAADGDVLWTYDGSTTSYFISPAIASDGTIYIGTDDDTRAIHPNGTLYWTYPASYWGAGGSPIVNSDGIIYITGDDIFDAIYPNGSMYWTFTTFAAYLSSPALAQDGTIYLHDGNAKLYALNPDGTEKWNSTIGYMEATPAIALDGTVYVAPYSTNTLLALNPDDGSISWIYSGFADDVASSPAVAIDGTIYVTCNDYKLHAVYPNGTGKWSFNTGGIFYSYSSLSISSDGTVYCGDHSGIVYAISPDGTEKWNYTTGGYILWSSPAIAEDGTIFIGSRDNKIYAFNPDGTVKWSYTTGDNIESSPAIAQDGTIYIGSNDGLFYAFEGSSPPLYTQQDFFDGNVPSYLTVTRGQYSAPGHLDPPAIPTPDVEDLITPVIIAVNNFVSPPSSGETVHVIQEEKTLTSVINNIATYIITPSNWIILCFAYIGIASAIVLSKGKKIFTNTLIGGTISWIIVLSVNFGVIQILNGTFIDLILLAALGAISGTVLTISTD